MKNKSKSLNQLMWSLVLFSIPVCVLFFSLDTASVEKFYNWIESVFGFVPHHNFLVVLYVVLVGTFVLVSIIRYLVRRKSEISPESPKSSKSFGNKFHIIIALSVSLGIIQIGTPTVYADELVDKDIVKEQVVNKNDAERGAVQPACVTQVVIFLLVTTALVVVGVKLAKVCNNIGEKRKKQIEDEDDGSTSTNQQRGVAFRLEPQTVYRASFFVNNDASQNWTDSESLLPLKMNFSVQQSGTVMTGVHLVTKTIDLDEYLVKYGLSTNIGETSFSIDGVSVSQLSEIVLSNGVVMINLPGMTNQVVNTLQFSSDMGNWQNILSNFVVPSGIALDIGVGPTNTTFYKLLSAPIEVPAQSP